MASKQEAAAIARLVADNIAGEGEARSLQQQLIALPGLDSTDIYTVKEISADESNHALLYEAMFKKYSGIAAAPDGAEKALAFIGEGIKGGEG